MYDSEVIEYAKEQENIISKLEYRVYKHDDGRSVNRQDLMRDYARVLYSSSFDVYKVRCNYLVWTPVSSIEIV